MSPSSKKPGPSPSKNQESFDSGESSYCVYHDDMASHLKIIKDSVQNLQILATDQAVQREQISTIREEIDRLFNSQLSHASDLERIIKLENSILHYEDILKKIQALETQLSASDKLDRYKQYQREKWDKRSWGIVIAVVTAAVVALGSLIWDGILELQMRQKDQPTTPVSTQQTPSMTDEDLQKLLKMLDEHGRVSASNPQDAASEGEQ